MSSRLEHALSSARDAAPAWDDDRASRVFSGAVRTRETRLFRHRAARRALVVASGATFLVLVLLRTAGGARPGPSATDPAAATQVEEPIATHALGDGGYARD
jgi:hypothetical protein